MCETSDISVASTYTNMKHIAYSITVTDMLNKCIEYIKNVEFNNIMLDYKHNWSSNPVVMPTSN